MASPESKNAEKQSLYADRLIDDQGNQDIRWLFDKDQTCMAPKPPNTAVLVLRRRICGCDKCAPYPKLFAAPPPPSEEDKKWAKAPATVELVRVSLIGGFANATGDRVVYPVEFTHVGTPKVLTLWCKQEHGFFETGSKFEEFIESYRFRSDSPWIRLAFFWADKKAQARRRGDEVAIKLLVWFLEGFDLRPGDKARIILERRRDAAGNFDDIACLPEAISIGRLTDFAALNRFFGKPDWEVGDVGLFIEKKKQLAVFRLTKERREEIRKFLDGREPLALGMEISRETALVLVLLLLWFVDKEWGAQLEEFFASPIKFVQEKCNAWRDKQLQGIQKGYEDKIKRTAYGEILGVMTPESRKAWSALRHNGKALLARAAAVMNVLEMIERGALWVAETFRISSFVDSVLRPDTLYSSAEEYFFVSFLLDETTNLPNGIVCPNLIPLGAMDRLTSIASAVSNQLFFWESADAFYLSLLNLDKHVRAYTAAKVKEESDGKEECRICGSKDHCDSSCEGCGQKYHRLCLWRTSARLEVGKLDCPRCLQRDAVVMK